MIKAGDLVRIKAHPVHGRLPQVRAVVLGANRDGFIRLRLVGKRKSEWPDDPFSFGWAHEVAKVKRRRK